MSISVRGPIDAGHSHVLYDLEVDGHGFSVTFYRGLESAGESGAWRAEIEFAHVVSRAVTSEGTTRQAAFRTAYAMHADALSRGLPLPDIDWPGVDRALAAKGAF